MMSGCFWGGVCDSSHFEFEDEQIDDDGRPDEKERGYEYLEGRVACLVPAQQHGHAGSVCPADDGECVEHHFWHAGEMAYCQVFVEHIDGEGDEVDQKQDGEYRQRFRVFLEEVGGGGVSRDVEYAQ